MQFVEGMSNSTNVLREKMQLDSYKDWLDLSKNGS